MELKPNVLMRDERYVHMYSCHMTEKCAKCGSIGYFFGTTAGYLYLILLIMYSSITFVNKHLAVKVPSVVFFWYG